MKKVLSVQIALLALTIIFGTVLKGNLDSFIREPHALLGILSAVMCFVAIVLSFIKQQPNSVKALTILTLIFICASGFAGKMLEETSNYNFYFNVMSYSAFTALLLSSFTWFKIKNN